MSDRVKTDFALLGAASFAAALVLGANVTAADLVRLLLAFV